MSKFRNTNMNENRSLHFFKDQRNEMLSQIQRRKKFSELYKYRSTCLELE